MKPKSKPRIAKPSPRQPGKGARVVLAENGKGLVLPVYRHSKTKPVLVLDLSPEARNSRRWAVEQTYLRCHDAEITDPWEIADLVLRSLGDTPAGEGRGK